MFDPVGMPLDFLVSMFAATFKLSRIQVAQSMAEAGLISLSIQNRCSLHPDEVARWIESLFNEPLNSCDQLRALIFRDIRRQSQTQAVETVSADVLAESLRMGMLGDKQPSTDQLKDNRDFVDNLLVYVRTKASQSRNQIGLVGGASELMTDSERSLCFSMAQALGKLANDKISNRFALSPN